MSGTEPIRTPLPKPPNTWLTLLMGAVLLVCGVVIGAGGTVLVVKNRMDQPGSAPEQFNRRLTERMTRDLDLTPEQSKQIRAVFDGHREEMKSIREGVDEQMNALRETMRDEVSEILSPEQLSQWESRVKEYDRRGPDHDRRRDGGRDRDGDRFDGPPPPHLRDGRPPPRHDGREGNRDGRRPPPDGQNSTPPPPRDDERRPPEGERPPPPPS